MNRFLLLLTGALLAATSLACQQHKKYVPSDPAKLGMIPKEAHVVAETSNVYQPLLFVAPADGTVWFFANDDLLATIGVKDGQRIELNALANMSSDTIISIDGKPAFKTGVRAKHNRLFYAPATKPVITKSDV